MRPLSIVHALPFFDPATRFGGPVAQLRQVCRLLADRGHRVQVITTDLDIGPDLPRQQWVERDGYRIWYARAPRLGQYAPYYAPGVLEPLDMCLPGTDVLHLSLSFTHMNVVAQRRAAAHGVPYVYTPRSCLDPVRLRQRRLLKLGFMALYERRIIRDAAAVHVLTEIERDQAVRQGAAPQQCTVIPNGCGLDADMVFPDGETFRRRFDIPPRAPMVLFLGRLHRIKGLDVLVDAFATLRQRMPAAQLVIAGPDEGEHAVVENQARRLGILEAVHLVGPLDGDLRLAALRAADVFALTSLSEGMPNAVLEACAAGTPVLISDRCNLPEVSSFSAGRIVEVRAGAVAGALVEILADQPRLESMGENGRRMVRERFAFSTVIDRLERMYEQLAGPGMSSAAPGAPAVQAA